MFEQANDPGTTGMTVVDIGRTRTSRDNLRRYRPVAFSFDFRQRSLDIEIGDDWEDDVKAMHRENQQALLAGLVDEYGQHDLDRKLDDFRAVGIEPISIYSVHNDLLRQVRAAFVFGSYFTALVGAAALGERILNQVVLGLRDKHFATHPATRRLRSKKSIDNWDVLITTLLAWGVIDSDQSTILNRLKVLRNRAVHFNIKDLHETGGRSEALEAILLLQEFIEGTFAAFGSSGLFIPGISGSAYLKLDAESLPFVKEFFLPACALLSPVGRYRSVFPVVVEDDPKLDDGPNISDETFADLVEGRRKLADIPS